MDSLNLNEDNPFIDEDEDSIETPPQKTPASKTSGGSTNRGASSTNTSLPQVPQGHTSTGEVRRFKLPDVQKHPLPSLKEEPNAAAGDVSTEPKNPPAVSEKARGTGTKDDTDAKSGSGTKSDAGKQKDAGNAAEKTEKDTGKDRKKGQKKLNRTSPLPIPGVKEEQEDAEAQQEVEAAVEAGVKVAASEESDVEESSITSAEKDFNEEFDIEDMYRAYGIDVEDPTDASGGSESDSPGVTNTDGADTPESSENAAESLTEDSSEEDIDPALASFYSDDDEDEEDDFDLMDDDDEELYNILSGNTREDEDMLSGFDIDAVLSAAIDEGASDVHLTPDDHVDFTVLGDIRRKTEFAIPTGTIMDRVRHSIISNELNDDFNVNWEMDTSYVVKTGPHKGRRMRLSVGKTFGHVFMVFRIIADQVPTPEELGVDEELSSWVNLPNGLIMLNGPTGTGKALRLDTPIPTPSGNTTMGELNLGSKVLGSDGKPANVVWVSDVNPTPELYRVTFANGQVVYADAPHQWIVANEETRTATEERDTTFFSRANQTGQLANIIQEIAQGYTGTFMPVESVLPQIAIALSMKYGSDKLKNNLEFLNEKSFASALEWGLDALVPEGGLCETSRIMSIFAAWLRERYVVSHRGVFLNMTTKDMAERIHDHKDTSERTLRLAVPTVLDESAAWNFIVSIKKVDPDSSEYGPVRCIQVDSFDSSYLCADNVITHNSTTLASLLKRIQLTRPQKIITLERPVEFMFGYEGKARVHQREIGLDSRSFEAGLTSAMRQAPDIIMVGEVRNQTEVNELLRSAETGHLSISTMHTNSAAATLNRIKSLYSGDDQKRVLATLGDVARGFANQVLVKSPDETKRTAVREVLTVTPEVSRMILKGDVEAIREYQIRKEITMEHGLVKAVKDGNCTPKVAMSQSSYPHLMRELFEKNGIDYEKG